jgi:hypothetical protein
MQTDIPTLQDLFKIGYDAFEDSRLENAEILEFFHNRQYTDSQLATLASRGQPAETFNVIKLFGRLILGYYSTVVNTIKTSPKQYQDILTASLLNDVVDYTMQINHFETEGDKIKLDGLIQGLMCCYVNVVDTPERDQFGRIIRKIELSHVPAEEIIIDPLSRLEDYSDGRFLHRFKWMSEEELVRLIKKHSKKKAKAIIDKLTAYHNHLQIDQTEFEHTYGIQFDGYFKKYNNYLVVHTIIKDEDDKVWSIYWSADEEIAREEVTYKEVKFPYRVHKIHTSNKTEYYGIFREILETQKAINQALLKIQLMVNTQKAFVEKGGVENLAEFTDQFNRVNAVIPVNSLKKIKIENLTREVIDQYTVIDKALDRIQRVLGVNDSFLGMAFASDSGRKVKLQQNATSLALRYVSIRIEQFYRLLGWDIVNLVKQYYTATQVLRIADETVGERWVQVNQPMTMWTGKFDPQGQPIMDYVWEEVLDPATGEPEVDENGRYIIAPVPTQETEIAFTDVDLTIDSVIYNDEDEKNQLMLETILQGNIGSMLMQVNPAGYFKAAGLAVKSMKSKHSIDISEILSQTSQMIAGAGNMVAADPAMASSQPGSSLMKLPQNTNEGV